MQHNRLERIYIDTNVLVYWLLPLRKETTKPCTDFMNDVKSGRYTGVISDLTSNELIKAIRKILVRNGETTVSVWERTVKNALNLVYELNENFVFVYGFASEADSNNMDFGEMSIDATNLIRSHPGRIKIGRRGIPIHDGLSSVDTLHAVLARRMSCSKIATFDNDFDEISDYIPRLNIKKEYGGTGLSK